MKDSSEEHVMNRTISFLFILLVLSWIAIGCGGEQPSVDFEATINAQATLIAENDVVESPPSTLLSTEPSSSNTSLSTNTSVPPTSTPNPTSTPSPIPPTLTSTPDSRLFWDDFEDELKPEWRIKGGGQVVANDGKLETDGVFNALVGDGLWEDYAINITFDYIKSSWINHGGIRLALRIQENGDYLAVKLECGYAKWIVHTNNIDTDIPNGSLDNLNLCGGGELRIVTQGDEYSLYENGIQKLNFTYPISTMGDVGLLVDDWRTQVSISDFQVLSLSPSLAPTLQLPSADSYLFIDNFENGIDPKWNIDSSGQVVAINGQFSTNGMFSAFVGDGSWDNYAVEMIIEDIDRSWINHEGLRIAVRTKENGDYVAVKLECGYMKWIVHTNNSDIDVPNAQLGGLNLCAGGELRIEVNGNNFLFYENGIRRFAFSYSGFDEGYVGVITNDDRTQTTIDEIQIIELP